MVQKTAISCLNMETVYQQAKSEPRTNNMGTVVFQHRIKNT